MIISDEIQIGKCHIYVKYSAKQIKICYVRAFTVFDKKCTEQANIEWTEKNNRWHVDLTMVWGYERKYVDTPYLGIELIRQHLELPFSISSSEMEFLTKYLSIPTRKKMQALSSNINHKTQIHT